MSTKAAEHYGDNREWVTCKICCGRFVAHHHYEYRFFKMPVDVCIWCYSRGFNKKTGLYYRWETMERALKAIAAVPCLKEEVGFDGMPIERPDCKCLTCFAKRTWEKVDGSRPQRPDGVAAKLAEVATKLPDDSGMAEGTTAEGPSGQGGEQVSAGV